MNPSYYRISLDVHDATSQLSFPIKKGDTSRRLLISLVDNGVPYDIADECYAIFVARKPDGKLISNDCTIQKNLIIYDITEQTSSMEGRLDCEITLFGLQMGQITSPRFTIIVYATTGSEADSEITSTSEYKALMSLLSEANELVNTVESKLENGEFVGERGETNVVNITRMQNPVLDASNLPLPPPEGNGACYIAKNSVGKLWTYSYNSEENAWESRSEVRSHTIYINLDDGCLYRYTMSEDTFPYPNFVQITKSSVVNITRMQNPVWNSTELPLPPPEGNGACYIAKNPSGRLCVYSYNSEENIWQPRNVVTSHTLYVNFTDGCIYRATNSTNTVPYPNFIRVTVGADAYNELSEANEALTGAVNELSEANEAISGTITEVAELAEENRLYRLPSVAASDNGKILQVANGKWIAVELPVYDGTVTVV